MKYYIKTFGCQMNVSDSERIASFLETQPHPDPLLIKERGLKATKDIAKADIIIFNTCGVRQMAEDRVYGQIHNIRKKEAGSKKKEKRKIIILTGCLANRKDVKRKLKDKVDLFCEIKEFQKKLDDFINCHPEFISGSKDKIEMPNQVRHDNYLCISPKYTNAQSAFVPIMTGCNNFCAYCVVPYARGREVSRPMEEILSEIKKLAENNCKEITLLGQNVNSYQFTDKNSSADEADKFTFPKLLNSLAQSFPKINFKFMTSHPKDFSEKLMEVIADNKNISREIHLPFQSGSNKILSAMNRPYTQKHYLALIKKAREIIPEVSFTTDVIVGFPGETQKDFEESAKVFRYVKFSEAYINKYSPRPGTAAEKLGDPISWDEKKRRERILRELL
jgi:tRNA-2-methylthio-N6-dimethylallyladenosine synthase